jgi:hypothetical protein
LKLQIRSESKWQPEAGKAQSDLGS